MIKVNQEKCIGCGLCADTCPSVFKMNEETGKSEVISQEINDCDINQVIENCPVDAISND